VAGVEELVARARALEAACAQRVEAMRRLASESTVAAKQLHDAEQEHFEAAQAVLDTDARAAASRVEAAQAELDAVTAEARVAGLEDEAAIQAGRRTSAELAYRRHLEGLAALTGLPSESLAAETEAGPAWLALGELTLTAPGEGVVVALQVADGGWVDAGDELAVVEDGRALVFRGHCPEADLSRIPTDARVRVVVEGAAQPIATRLTWPPREADPVSRTVLLEARVANPDARWPDGHSATAHVVLSASGVEETLVPLDCVTRDGLQMLAFRVDPQDAGRVIRTPLTLGERNRTHVVVLAGAQPGDRLVQAGIHQLRQASGAQQAAGGHFHADGTWHAGPDHK
jgi:multidrug efflux pump subunit AcrA (membrane-fusion protein)